jgi:hypothetical protein
MSQTLLSKEARALDENALGNRVCIAFWRSLRKLKPFPRLKCSPVVAALLPEC